MPNPFTFVLDVFFYGVLLRFVVYGVSIVRGEERVQLSLIMLSSAVLLLGTLLGLVLYWPYLAK